MKTKKIFAIIPIITVMLSSCSSNIPSSQPSDTTNSRPSCANRIIFDLDLSKINQTQDNPMQVADYEIILKEPTNIDLTDFFNENDYSKKEESDCTKYTLHKDEKEMIFTNYKNLSQPIAFATLYDKIKNCDTNFYSISMIANRQLYKYDVCEYPFIKLEEKDLSFKSSKDVESEIKNLVEKYYGISFANGQTIKKFLTVSCDEQLLQNAISINNTDETINLDKLSVQDGYYMSFFTTVDTIPIIYYAWYSKFETKQNDLNNTIPLYSEIDCEYDKDGLCDFTCRNCFFDKIQMDNNTIISLEKIKEIFVESQQKSEITDTQKVTDISLYYGMFESNEHKFYLHPLWNIVTQIDTIKGKVIIDYQFDAISGEEITDIDYKKGIK